MNKKLSMALLLAAAGFLALLFASLVVVDETEVALPVRFGRISGEPMKPGLHLFAPRPVGSVFRIDRRKLLIRIPPTEFLSADKKNLLLDFAAVYRIEDPALFLQRVRDIPGAESRLVDLSISALGAIAGRSPADAFFSIDAEKVKLLALSEEVRTSVDTAAKGFGIRVDSAWITQVHFPYQNREAIISRMRAERDRIARRLRSEGEEAAQKIEAEAEQEKRRLLAEAARDAEVTRGKGDADAARLYAQAYRLDPRLYEFIRALSAYEKMAGKETTLFLDADGPAMRLLTRGPNAEVPSR